VVPDEERARQILEQLKSVHAFDLAYETMVGLVNFGSQKMGLLEETREVRDLADARLSIELVRAILEVIEREQGDERTRGLHDALAQMQLAYAHAVQLANAERAAARESEPASEGGAAAEEPETAPAAEAEAEVQEEPAAEKPAARKPAAKKKPAAGKKPAPKKQPAAGKKPAPKKKPAGES
jgi:outer membrane biosynthesis protein TonB